jgi:hypothetical protein
VSSAQFEIGGCSLSVHRISDTSIFNTSNPENIIIFLQGGVIKTINGRTHRAIMPGDVGQVKVVQQVVAEMDGVEDNTIIIMIIQK